MQVVGMEEMEVTRTDERITERIEEVLSWDEEEKHVKTPRRWRGRMGGRGKNKPRTRHRGVRTPAGDTTERALL